ncbi:MAG: hypothetical protein HUN04_23760 [Desulfobacter sp.]|nr:MAG: hypothetical protein HUN04_23760 [Desulfobacter sp.]
MTYSPKTNFEPAANGQMEELIERGRILHSRAVAGALLKVVDGIKSKMRRPENCTIGTTALKKA